MRHQCELLGFCRSSYYYQYAPETEANLALMRRLDELHLEHPVYGSRKLTVCLRQEGLAVKRKCVVRLLRLMGIGADLRQATDKPAGARPPNLSVSIARFGGEGAGPSLVFGHHLCADGHRIHVSGGGDGLVDRLAIIHHIPH